MADNKNENKQSQAMLGSYDANWNYVDPYWVTFYDGFTGKDLHNADTEKSAYWDDSTLATYNTGNNKWGTNDKYTWENTRNTYTWYNADITTADLNPDYQYWWLAQQQESIEQWYIANRNDNIASALYNEWKRSIEDVANYLNQQKWFQNSTEEQRQNTINSVWKRIGDIDSQNQISDTEQVELNESPQDTSNEALSNMENDLNKSTAGELYGKVTADANTHINTLEDENSVYKAMNQSRIQTFKNLQVASSEWLAAAIVSGSMASDSQAMRDLMQYDPQKYQEIQAAVKQLRGQMNINAITSGEWDYNTSATNGQSGLNNDIANFAIENSGLGANTVDILKNVNQTLSSNQSYASASEQMSSIENDMSNLQNRLKNLKKEANQIFKWDVPQYIVNAYISNRTAEIQDQLSILENRYNAAQSRATDEYNKVMNMVELGIKLDELQLKKDAAALNAYASWQGKNIDLSNNNWWYSDWLNGNNVPTTALSREEISSAIDDLVTACNNWQLPNAQCAAWIQTYYLPTLWVSLWTLSKWSEKQWICNEWKDYTPDKWDLVVIDSGATLKDWTKSWHMWIVIGIEWDTMTYLDWNGTLDANKKWTETPEIRTTKLSNSKIYGYYNPTKGQSQNGWADEYYNPNYADIYSNFLQWKMYTEARLKTAIESVWASDIDWLRAQANAWKNAQATNDDAMNMLRAVEYLMWQWASKFQRQLAVNDNWWGVDVFGWVDRLFSWDAANYNSYYNFIKSNMTLEHLVDLKNRWATFWALSNQELSAIANAALALSTDMWEYEYNSQLFTIYNNLRKNVWEQELSRKQFDAMIGAEDDDKVNVRRYYLSSIFSDKTPTNAAPTNAAPTNAAPTDDDLSWLDL